MKHNFIYVRIGAMILNWLISLSSMLFTSVIEGDPQGSLHLPAGISEYHEKKETVDNSKIASEADLVKALGGIYHGEFVPREDLLAMSKNELTKEFFTRELLQIVESRLPENFSYPPIKEVIKFRDISLEDPIFEVAQKLKSLEVLPENDGFFGKPNEKNPKMKIFEINQILNRAFDKKGDLNFFQDKDADGIPNALDACPDIPAKKGCPEQKEAEKFPNDTVLKVSNIINVVEEIEIQIGDKFSAIIFDPETGEIFTQSDPVIITK